MFARPLLALAILLVALSGAALLYHYVDEETDPPFEPADSSGTDG